MALSFPVMKLALVDAVGSVVVVLLLLDELASGEEVLDADSRTGR